MFGCMLIASTASANETTPTLPAWTAPIIGHPFVGIVTKEPVIAVTIDDVRASDVTTPFADTLVKNGIHASFFCVVSAMSTETARYCADRGIELADHSWTHVALDTLDPAQRAYQIDTSAWWLDSAVGTWPLWFRSPYLGFGADGASELASDSLLYAGESIYPRDYRTDMTAPQVVQAVSEELRPGGVLLLHDTAKTMAAIPGIAAVLRARGYRTATMSELATAGPAAHSISDMTKTRTSIGRMAVSGWPKRNRTFRLSGSLGPEVKRKVVLRLYVATSATRSRLVRKLTTTTSSKGGFTVKLKLPRGTYRVRVTAATSDLSYGVDSKQAWRFRVR